MCKGIRTRNSASNRFRNNKLRFFNVKALYYKLWFGDSGGVSNPPPDDAVQKYWGGLFGDRAKHNDDADWIKEEEEEMEAKLKAVWVDVTVDQIRLTTAKLSNWKSPGLDQVQNFWLKYLTALHPVLSCVCIIVVRPPVSHGGATEGSFATT